MAEDEPQPHGKGILHPEGMRATRDLAAGIVHEVNNILGVIIGNAHLARKSLSDTTGLERYMGEVRDAAEEGRELMRNLAILAGEAPHRARLLPLNDLVANATSGLSKPVELDLSSEDPTVELDLWLAQDAVSCAVRFMADTKAVTSIRVGTHMVGAAAALSMEDDGSSLTEKDLGALFTPFAKIDGRPKAGLSLTKLADLASRCGGQVTAAVREPNGGLRIVLTLPIASAVASGDGPGVALPKKRL